MSGRSSGSYVNNNLPPQELLDDLCSRFVLNVPKEDQQSFERILFLVEYAHWFYEDNTVEKNPSLKSFTLKEFTTLLFNNCEVLKPYVPHIDDIFKDFTSYKVRVPVTGAIILDQSYERCILVKGWKGTSWSFPRGKKNKDEEDHACAVREEIAWQRLDDLEPASNEVISRGVTGLKLYMVSPFLMSLRAWITNRPRPVTSKFDAPIRGISVWKAKNSSLGSNVNQGETHHSKAAAADAHNKTTQDVKNKKAAAANTAETDPGKSFRSFRFDTGSILRAMGLAFS